MRELAGAANLTQSAKSAILQTEWGFRCKAGAKPEPVPNQASES